MLTCIAHGFGKRGLTLYPASVLFALSRVPKGSDPFSRTRAQCMLSRILLLAMPLVFVVGCADNSQSNSSSGNENSNTEQAAPLTTGTIQVVAELNGGGLQQEGFRATSDALQAHPNLRGIFAINDPSALGAWRALKQADKFDQVTIIGFDGQLEGKQAILEGKIYADPIQFPRKMAVVTVENIVKYLNGDDFEPVQLIPTAIYKKEDALSDPELKALQKGGEDDAGTEKAKKDDAPTEKNGTIGYSAMELKNPFFKIIADKITEEAKKQGYDVVVNDAERKVDSQSKHIDNYIAQSVTAIVINPVDRIAIGPSIRKANEAGIPVFTNDLQCVAKDVEIAGHIGTDNHQGGKLAGHAMIEALGDEGGQVLVLHFKQANSCVLRVQGFTEVIDAHNKKLAK